MFLRHRLLAEAVLVKGERKSASLHNIARRRRKVTTVVIAESQKVARKEKGGGRGRLVLGSGTPVGVPDLPWNGKRERKLSASSKFAKGIPTAEAAGGPSKEGERSALFSSRGFSERGGGWR